jgi:circadian clock protein KaiC
LGERSIQVSEHRKKLLIGKGVVSSTQLKKVATGIHGLDSVLKGGLPAGRATLLCGGPGTGKSVLALEFLYRGALAGESGIFVTFEERADVVRQNAATLGWDLAALERSGKLFIMEARLPREAVNTGDFNLSGLLSIIAGKARRMKAQRLVFDALDVLMRVYRDPYREQDELYVLHDWISNLGVTSIITAKMYENSLSTGNYEFLHYMADCVINLEQRIQDRIANRLLLVIKYRGSDFGHNENSFIIIDDGVKFTPLSSTTLDFGPSARTVSIGHPGMDAVMGGPIHCGTCLIVSGSPGTGKTTIACTFSRAACTRKERVLYVSFEESEESIIDCMLSPGIDLRPAVKAGRLKFLSFMPESAGANVHLYRILQAVDQFKPDHLVIDAVTSSLRMGAEHTAFDFAIRLVSFCKEMGITTLLTAQLEGVGGMSDISGLNISSLADTVVVLRYIDVGGEMNRMLLVIKARGRRHSNQYREFLITSQGIGIADVYVGEGGVLTGSARQEQEMKERIAVSRRRRTIKETEAELEVQKAARNASDKAIAAEILKKGLELEALKAEEALHLNGRESRAVLRGTGSAKRRRKLPSPPLKKG